MNDLTITMLTLAGMLIIPAIITTAITYIIKWRKNGLRKGKSNRKKQHE